MATDVLGHDAPVDVIATAGAITDDHSELLSLVEIGNGVSTRLTYRQ